MKESLRAATLTFYYHAYGLTGIARPPMTLSEAVERLRQGTNAEDEGRRRRVIVKLVGAGLDRHAEYRQAIERLEPQLHGRSWDILIPGLRDFDRFAAEIAIVGELGKILGPVGCNRTWPNTSTGRDSATQTTWVDVSLRVKRPLNAVARIVDPQTWDESSPYFVFTYVPVQAPNGTVAIDPVTHYPNEDPTPPTRGTTWQDLLFEHFESSVQWQGVATFASFHNLLSIQTRFPDVSTFRMNYQLDRAIRSRIGVSEMAGGVDIDEGFGQAHLDSDDWVTLTARKTLRFTPRPDAPPLHLWLNNYGAEVALLAMGEEFYEAVCS